mgnify:CR=1 FL=1
MNTKAFQRAAFRNEGGATGSNQATGWGTTNVNNLPGTGDGIPYLSLGKSKTISSVPDNSIVSEGFDDLPRQVTKYVEQSVSYVNKLDGFNPQLYWAFGLCDEVLPVVCYVCSSPVTEPVAGATYTDSSANSLTFLRKEVNGSYYTLYVFTQTAVVSSQSGSLTRVSGTGSDLTFNAHSSILYESVFKIDPRERHLVVPAVTQRISTYQSGDLKCRMATIGVNMDTNSDFLFINAMCKKFNVSSSAGALSELSTDFLARDREVSNYSSSTWTYPSAVDADNNILHHYWSVYVNNTLVGCTSFNLGFEIPLQVIQDTLTGLFIAEPVMEGKYVFNSEIVLSRYSSLAWENLSDAWTEVPARIAAYSGYKLQEFFINNAIITNASPDDDNVAKQKLKLELGTSLTNNFPSQGLSITDYSPLMCRVRNTTATNYMRV